MPDGTPNITADFSHIGQQAGSIDWRVSAQWAKRPADQRYRTMDDLIAALDRRQQQSLTTDIEVQNIVPTLVGNGDVRLDIGGALLDPTNFSFSQYCRALNVPTGLLTDRLSSDPDLVVRVLQHAANTCDDPEKEVRLLHSGSELRGLTSTSYGRIWDRDIAKAVKQMCDDSGMEWEVPVAFARPGETKFSYVPTTEETTLYASDRDIFCFLVDQKNPIQAGWRTDAQTGERVPDMYSRGFYFWNGECGDVSNGVSTFLYSWACSNRSIRGQKGVERVSITHTKNAAEIFAKKLVPALRGFIEGSATGIIDGILAAKRERIARDDEGRMKLLSQTLDLGPKVAAAVMQKCIDEEGHPIETVYDAHAAMTAYARSADLHQSDRVQLERTAGKVLKDCLPEFA